MTLPAPPASFRQIKGSGLFLPTSLVNQLRHDAIAEFRAAATNRLRTGWNLGRTNATPAHWTLQRLREYCRDLDRNDPVASGTIDTFGINIVGQGLQPQSKLRADILGLSEDRAQYLQRQAESIFSTWKTQADASNRFNFDELQFLALNTVIRDGEVFAHPTWADEGWRFLGRCLELLEADRLTTVGAKTLTGQQTGIDVGGRGEPAFYNFTKIDPAQGIDSLGGDTERIPARDNQGRPNILHLYRARRPNQFRGYPLFTPVITLFQDMADFLEARVVAAKVASFLSVFITTGDQYGSDNFATATEAATGKNIEDLEPGEIRYLRTGERVEVIDPTKGGDTFSGFTGEIFRLMGMGIGLPYELFTKDFTKTNYSAARAALLEGRRLFQNWRYWLANNFCQPNWELVLEEAVLRGLWEVRPRDFYANRAEYLRADWLGGGWGWVDPVKEVAAAIAAILAGLSTHSRELAIQGEDWQEVFKQLAAEQQYANQHGLSFTAPKTSGGAGLAEGGPPADNQPGTLQMILASLAQIAAEREAT
ncbi:MAG: phage portal protein [Candidatus Thermoplasmatota archaeon]|nr:phage portal protein [Candidatus Thermoplasmatota archaeon]